MTTNANYVIALSEKEVVQIHMAIQERILVLKQRMKQIGPDAFEQKSIEILVQAGEKLMSSQRGVNSND